MKKLDKIADEAACGWYNEMHAAEWFKVGFKAAIKMSVEVLKEWDISWYEEDTKLAAQLHHRWTQIEKLGEEEV